MKEDKKITYTKQRGIIRVALKASAKSLTLFGVELQKVAYPRGSCLIATVKDKLIDIKVTLQDDSIDLEIYTHHEIRGLSEYRRSSIGITRETKDPYSLLDRLIP